MDAHEAYNWTKFHKERVCRMSRKEMLEKFVQTTIYKDIERAVKQGECKVRIPLHLMSNENIRYLKELDYKTSNLIWDWFKNLFHIRGKYRTIYWNIK